MVINNVNYLSHYIVGNEVILVNVNEIEVSDHAKFGNGIIKKEKKKTYVSGWKYAMKMRGVASCLSTVCKLLMPGLWSRYRSDETLMQRFKEFTEKKFDNRRGYGIIGDRTVIQNCRIIKDAMIGSDAYIKGAVNLKTSRSILG